MINRLWFSLIWQFSQLGKFLPRDKNASLQQVVWRNRGWFRVELTVCGSNEPIVFPRLRQAASPIFQSIGTGTSVL